MASNPAIALWLQSMPPSGADRPLDAFVDVPDPDALAAEFAARHVEFSKPLKDTDDGLRGFELMDPDGYVLFFRSSSVMSVDGAKKNELRTSC